MQKALQLREIFRILTSRITRGRCQNPACKSWRTEKRTEWIGPVREASGKAGAHGAYEHYRHCRRCGHNDEFEYTYENTDDR